MKAILLTIESQLLGRNMLALEGVCSAGRYDGFEREYVREFDPGYVFSVQEADNLKMIQMLLSKGFVYSEFRLKSRLDVGADLSVNESAFYPYRLDLISREEDLLQAIEMLQAHEQDDRFSRDPVLGKAFACKRNESNLRKSFERWPKEFLLGLYNTQRSSLVAFRSGAFLSKTEAHYYQYGITQGADFEHTALMLETLSLGFLIDRGVEFVHAVSTGFNTSELNRLLKHFDFHIVSSQILLRKTF